MVHEYYSPVGGKSLAFYCIEDIEQRAEAEIWNIWPSIPAASMAKAGEALALYATCICYMYVCSIRHFPLTEKARVRIASEPHY